MLIIKGKYLGLLIFNYDCSERLFFLPCTVSLSDLESSLPAAKGGPRQALRILSRRFRTHPLNYQRQIEQISGSSSREQMSQEGRNFNGSVLQSSYPTSSTPTQRTLITMGAIWKEAWYFLKKKSKINSLLHENS